MKSASGSRPTRRITRGRTKSISIARQRPAELDAADQRIVLLGDVRADVGDEDRIGDRGVAGDLAANPTHTLVDQLLLTRAQRIEDGLQRLRPVPDLTRRHGLSSPTGAYLAAGDEAQICAQERTWVSACAELLSGRRCGA